MFFLLKKNVKSSSDGRAHSRSIGRGRICRKGALDHRESRERREKNFAEKTENANIFKKKLDQENSFKWGIFIFLAAGKLTFLGGG